MKKQQKNMNFSQKVRITQGSLVKVLKRGLKRIEERERIVKNKVF